MGIPISVGDAILLSQIAWSIGEAFTSGRKSAPAEFAEIQDLLFTLGEALKVLAKDLPVGNQVAQAERVADGQADNAVPEADDALLAQMILNCRSTLTYLKAMVDRYMELDKNDGQRGQKKWKDEVKKNWKKLLWTKEGGDIIKLKTTLSAHINGLNLALSAINKRYGREVKSHVEGMHTKLDSIYEWFKQNLQGQQAATASASPQYHLGSEVQNHGGLWFSVSIQIMPGREYMNLHCPRATFRDNWLDDKDPFRVAPSIFQCCCSRNSTALDHAESLHVSLLPSSLLVQVATLDSEPPRWHMYAASRSTPHRISSIYISEVEPTNFEAAASCLSLVQARQHLLRNQTTRLVSFNATAGSSSDEYSDGIVSVLASKTEQVPEYDEGTCTLLFTVGERQFRAAADSAYSVLHYKSMPEGAVRQAPSDTSFSKPEDTSRGGIPLSSAMDFELQQPHAEVLFQETNKMLGGGGDSTYYISFHHNTTISRGSGRRTICLHDILVVSEQKTDSSHSATIQQIKCTSVDVEFGESTGKSLSLPFLVCLGTLSAPE
ncbi:uncharacterized protein BDR25DRAFT_104635 [Lindgomyces ingoldianus]|uniref:Uncharacterized protein n=1 Tax=Lindgomyces ingoldianus TaxID=673940 RepID=A0ACB6QAJ0_9PLEO|nr:uncharacterized protein BDR25DRAFT_104635 [Lindgomyces ingoldianus]KAF2463984.1 hypothetical protein BDR25DRAFT_104635 [Lindgomyces ingoldianus]